MRYLSICSGLGGAELAFGPLGWECAAVSEVDPTPCAVLAARFPTVPNIGDFTKIGVEDVGSIDLLVGGTPCQDFSVAGLRAGMDGDRGQLTIEFARLAERLRPRWLVWENVPGVLSIDGGRAFGTFLGILGKFGYGFAYRILDAQYCGVPQRRRRVFVVGYLGDWRCAAAVLFERQSLSGYPAPRREKGQGVAGCLKGGSGERGWPDPSDGNGGGLIAGTLGSGYGDRGRDIDGAGAFIPIGPTGSGKDTFPCLCANYGDKWGLGDQEAFKGDHHILTPKPIYASDGQANASFAEDVALTINATHEQPYVTAFRTNAAGQVNSQGDQSAALTSQTDPCSQILAFTQNSRDEVRVIGEDGEVAGSLSAETGTHQTTYLAFTQNQAGDVLTGEVMHSLGTNSNATGRNSSNIAYQPVGFIHPRQLRGSETSNQVGIKPEADISDALTAEEPGAVSFEPSQPMSGMQVRRLTPVECERLQGIPDNWTKLTEKSADGPRYRMIGNSFAVPVVAWIGKRVQMVEDIINGTT